MLLFRGSKSSKSSDYHTEMNWNVFGHWCESKVFPALKKIGRKSVLVLDRATYRTVLDENDKRPVEARNKKRIVDSIIRWNGVPDDWTLNWAHQKSKSQLLDQAKKIYPAPKYKIQKITASSMKVISRLRFCSYLSLILYSIQSKWSVDALSKLRLHRK